MQSRLAFIYDIAITPCMHHSGDITPTHPHMLTMGYTANATAMVEPRRPVSNLYDPDQVLIRVDCMKGPTPYVRPCYFPLAKRE